jgi:hypothetical protein
MHHLRTIATGLPFAVGLSVAAPLLGAREARAECPQPTHRAELALHLQAAEDAFGRLDRQAFGTFREGVLADLACLSEPLWPSEAARVHGLMALDAFLRHDDGSAVTNLRAATLADPAFDLPLDLFPAGHPLRLELQVARGLVPGAGRPLPLPAEGNVTVDGAPAEQAPGERPAILQWLVPPEVRGTVYLAPGDPLPAWGELPRTARVRTPRAPHPWGLVAASGGAALVAGGCWGLAAERQARLLEPATPYAELRPLRAQADLLTASAWLAGATAVGLGVTAGFSW